MTQKTKNVAIEIFLEQTTLKTCGFWAGEALEAWTWDYLNITLAQNDIPTFSKFLQKKFVGLTKEFFCTYWMNREVLPYGFCKLQPPKLDKNVQEPFWQAGKLFSAEIWKMAECHFWANVMLR